MTDVQLPHDLASLTLDSPTSSSTDSRGPSIDDDTIRPGSMKRPVFSQNFGLESISKSLSDGSHEEILSAVTVASIFDKYADPTTTPDPDSPTLRDWDSCDLKEPAGSFSSGSLPLRSVQTSPVMQMSQLRNTPSLSSIPEAMSAYQAAATEARQLRQSSSQVSLRSMDHQHDLFGFRNILSRPTASTDCLPNSAMSPAFYSPSSSCGTPALARKNSSTSSSSLSSAVNSVNSPTDFFKQAFTSSRLDIEVLESPNSSIFPSQEKLNIINSDCLYIQKSDDLAEPVSPLSASKVGLGITTPDVDEPQQSQTPYNTPHKLNELRRHTPSPSFSSVSGRQRINTDVRSRSSSVAERIERARLSIQHGQRFSDDQHKALIDSPASDAVVWDLGDCRPALSVLAALNDAPTLRHLTTLNISNCDLDDIPSSLASLISIQHLDVSQNNLVRRSLPPFLGALSNLRSLKANYCNIHSLSYSFASWHKLTSLTIEYNQLTHLPAWLSQLEDLKHLGLRGNPFVGQWRELTQALLQPPRQPSRASTLSAMREIAPWEDAESPMNMLPHRALPPLPRSSPDSVGRSMPTTRPESKAAVTAFSSSANPSRAQSPDTANSAASSITFAAAHEPVRPPRPNNTPQIRQMRSVGDLARAQSSRVRSSSIVSPMDAELVSGQWSPASDTSATAAEPMRKSSGFFKKFSSMGRARRDTNAKQADAMDAQSTYPQTQDQKLAERTRKASAPIMLQNASPPVLSRATSQPSVKQGSRISRLNLASVPTPPYDRMQAVSSPTSEDEPLSAIESSNSALKSLMAYLRDMNDLAPPQHSSPFKPSVSRTPSMSRDSMYGKRPALHPSTASDASLLPSRHSQSTLSTEYDGSRMPHSSASASTSMTSVSSFHSKQHKVDASRRERIINEIVSTERAYIQHLSELVDIYVRPSAQVISKGMPASPVKETVIPAAERKAVFLNVESLLDFHRLVFFPELEAVTKEITRQRDSAASDSSEASTTLRLAAEDIAAVFNRHGQFLKMYSSYVNAFDGALQKLQTWAEPTMSEVINQSALTTTQRKRIRAFLKAGRLDPRHTQISLESYLLMPVQRIPRYKMLLENLVSCTPADDEFDAPNLRLATALELVTNLASQLNEKKREAEGRQRILYWQSRIGNRFKSPLVQPHRLLLGEACLTLSKVVKREHGLVSSPLLPENHREPSMLQIPSLRIDGQNKRLFGLLANDLLVLLHDNGNLHEAADLFTVIRFGNLTSRQCATVFGSGSTLRLVDTRSVLYFEMGSALEAAEWASIINAQVSVF